MDRLKLEGEGGGGNNFAPVRGEVSWPAAANQLPLIHVALMELIKNPHHR